MALARSRVSHTACRTALLVTGDIVSATEYIQHEVGIAGTTAPVSQLIDDLRVFSASKRYSTLRWELGFSDKKPI